MTPQQATPAAYQLLHEGSIAFARMEAAGLRVDTAYLSQKIKDVTHQIEEMKQEQKKAPEYKLWVKHYGESMKLGSRPQLGKVIFDLLGHKRNPFMEGKNDTASFEHLQLPFVQNYQKIERLKKALATNLKGIQKEVVDGYLHPFFDLHTVESYRSSSSKPNFHNQPTRDKIIAEIVRSCIIPRKGNVFIESDYGTQEVRVSYCYNKDPKLLYDIFHGDMHKDRAMDLYKLSEEELGPISGSNPGKMTRYVVKNKFVFAEFYGSYYGLCAPALWDAISIFDLKTAQGVSLYEHLSRKGIKRLGACDPDKDAEKGTFELHVKEVETRMWKENYKVYDQWKRDWWNLYLQKGGYNTLTGFHLSAVFRRNQVLCDPIQGSAFHCLLWSLIQIQKELIRKKMKAKIVNQIHDSILADVPRKEVDDYITIVKKWALDKVVKHYDWIICPLALEFEICQENWFSKIPMEGV
jgi:DNA polymerase I